MPDDDCAWADTGNDKAATRQKAPAAHGAHLSKPVNLFDAIVATPDAGISGLRGFVSKRYTSRVHSRNPNKLPVSCNWGVIKQSAIITLLCNRTPCFDIATLKPMVQGWHVRSIGVSMHTAGHVNMRIAYIAPYQGQNLLSRRPLLRNLSLAANVKMELIAELLRRGQHEIEIISQGEVVEHRLRFYSSFAEGHRFHPDVPVFYASALPVKFVNGAWSARSTLNLFKRRHRESSFDLVIVYNLKRPQVVCANYAIGLGLPVVFEYEDEAFVDLQGRAERGFRTQMYQRSAGRFTDAAAACVAVSPHLLSRVRPSMPKMLLRGVVGEDILASGRIPMAERKPWVVYSGAHFPGKGLEPLIAAWNEQRIPGWELHIAGRGEITPSLEKMAAGNTSIVFHGLLDRPSNARLLGQARIGINPHAVSERPGNVFAFKIVEYLAAGLHCVTTPMGAVEAELEEGMTYIPDNTAPTIGRALKKLIGDRGYERIATPVAQTTYGPAAVARALNDLITGVTR
jgi:glycosyltransferase involved in cell wall biosynthesis